MKVQEILLSDGRVRYIVVDSGGNAIVPVTRYLKFLDGIGRSRNTIRGYAYSLTLYSDYLSQRELGYEDVTLDDIAGFIVFLKNPFRSVYLFPNYSVEQARSNATINCVLTAVSGLYTYFWGQDQLPSDLNALTKTLYPAKTRSYKTFLHHLSQGAPVEISLLKQKVGSGRPETLEQESVEALISACVSERDRLLVSLLCDTGMRIGEALGLWLEDIDIANLVLLIKDRGPLVNGAEIKSTASERKIDVERGLINQIMSYVARVHTEEVETNHLFITLRGANAGRPLTYPAVADLFHRLSKKTGLHVWPHLLRHTCLSSLAENGMRPETLQVMAGHGSFQTTYKTYVHASDRRIRSEWEEAREKIRERNTLAKKNQAADSKEEGK